MNKNFFVTEKNIFEFLTFSQTRANDSVLFFEFNIRGKQAKNFGWKIIIKYFQDK